MCIAVTPVLCILSVQTSLNGHPPLPPPAPDLPPTSTHPNTPGFCSSSDAPSAAAARLLNRISTELMVDVAADSACVRLCCCPSEAPAHFGTTLTNSCSNAVRALQTSRTSRACWSGDGCCDSFVNGGWCHCCGEVVCVLLLHNVWQQ